MIIDCCNQERSYRKFYGQLAERFARIQKTYEDAFCRCFVEQVGCSHFVRSYL